MLRLIGVISLNHASKDVNRSFIFVISVFEGHQDGLSLSYMTLGGYPWGVFKQWPLVWVSFSEGRLDNHQSSQM